MNMGASWGFELYFESGISKLSLKKRFLKAIAPHKLHGESLKSPEGFEGIWLKRPDSEYGGANYGLSVTTSALTLSSLTLSTDMTIDAVEMDILDKVLLHVAQKLDPLFSFSSLETRYTANESGAMYYRNPYFFAMEPPGADSHQYIAEFLEDRNILQKVAEIQRVLPLEELIELLKKYCKVVVHGKNGVGILKRDYEGKDFAAYATYVYPHYFLRQLVRSRGVQLDEGLAEKYAKEFGIK